MSDKDRRKKGGERKDKKNERMRADVMERKEAAAEPGVQHDKGDIYPKHVGKGSDTARIKGR